MKRVFISFLNSPVGSTFYLEGLRLALGTLSGSEDHNVTVAYLGRGARCALKGVDKSYAVGLIELFKKNAAGKRFYVDKESLSQEAISESELDESFEVTTRDELRKKILEADVTFSF
ncbi:MAG: DsrE family protein [Nitrososphaerota archaeon]|nr:DsrE family protein [Nitrososphaerota archaeon]